MGMFGGQIARGAFMENKTNRRRVMWSKKKMMEEPKMVMLDSMPKEVKIPKKRGRPKKEK